MSKNITLVEQATSADIAGTSSAPTLVLATTTAVCAVHMDGAGIDGAGIDGARISYLRGTSARDVMGAAAPKQAHFDRGEAAKTVLTGGWASRPRKVLLET